MCVLLCLNLVKMGKLTILDSREQEKMKFQKVLEHKNQDFVLRQIEEKNEGKKAQKESVKREKRALVLPNHLSFDRQQQLDALSRALSPSNFLNESQKSGKLVGKMSDLVRVDPLGPETKGRTDLVQNQKEGNHGREYVDKRGSNGLFGHPDSLDLQKRGNKPSSGTLSPLENVLGKEAGNSLASPQSQSPEPNLVSKSMTRLQNAGMMTLEASPSPDHFNLTKEPTKQIDFGRSYAGLSEYEFIKRKNRNRKESFDRFLIKELSSIKSSGIVDSRLRNQKSSRVDEKGRTSSD